MLRLASTSVRMEIDVAEGLSTVGSSFLMSKCRRFGSSILGANKRKRGPFQKGWPSRSTAAIMMRMAQRSFELRIVDPVRLLPPQRVAARVNCSRIRLESFSTRFNLFGKSCDKIPCFTSSMS